MHMMVKVGLWLKKCWHHLLYVDAISLFAKRNALNSKKLMKIVNIDEENIHIYRTT